jgi:hypothetical protein
VYVFSLRKKEKTFKEEKCCFQVQQAIGKGKTKNKNFEQHRVENLVHLPFSSGAFLYFSSRLTAIASSLTRAAGYSFNTSHISFLLNTNKSL